MAKHVLALAVALAGVVAPMGCVLEEIPDESTTEQHILPPPTAVMATPTSPTRITVSWTPVVGAVKYYVYERIGMNGVENYATTAVGTSVQRANLMPGTEYCYRIRTVDSTTFPGDFSDLACATTPSTAMTPPPPATVTATAVSSSRISVSWSPEPAATSYLVYQSDTGPNGTYAFVTSVVSPNTSTSVANLQAATTYCYRVASNNANGIGPMSSPACATTFVFGLEGFWKLNEGSGTTAGDVSGNNRNGTVVGTWTTDDRAPIDNNPWAVSLSGASGEAVNVPDAGVWWMTGPFSFAIWVKPTAAGAARIAGKRVAGCGTTNWELGADANGNLYLAGANTVSFGQTLPVGEWTHVALSFDGTTVTLYVNGEQTANGAFTAGPRSADPLQLGNAGGCGGAPVLVDWAQAYSRPLSATEVATIGQRPPAPTNLVATPTGCRTVSLTWDAVPGASKYFVYKGTTSGDQVFLNTVLAPNTTYNDGANPATCATTVSYYVRAAMNGLISDASNEQIVTTFPAIEAPTMVTATAVSSSRIHVSFSAVTGATKYYVYRSQPGGGMPFVFDGTVLAGNPLTYPSSNLAANTLYSYYVVTQGPDSTSVPSTTASATTAP